MATRIRNRASRPVSSMLNSIRRWDGATAMDALETIGGNWEPKSQTVHLPDGSTIDGHKAITNPQNGAVLGMTSDGYLGLPNSLLAEGIDKFASALNTGYKVSNASVFGNGKVVKLEVIVGDKVEIGIPNETVYQTISAYQGHGGNLPFAMAVQTKRLVCSNGLMVSIPGLSTAFSVRHTANGLAKVEWNFHLIQSSFADSTQKIQDRFKLLASKQADMASFRRFYRSYVESKLGETGAKADATIDSLEVIHFAPRNEIAGENMWRGFNVIQEFEQYHGFRTDEAMEIGNISGTAAKAKNNAFQFALDYALAN